MPRLKLNFHRAFAFTLLELSVSLAVVGVVLGGAVVVVGQQAKKSEQKEVREDIDAIMDALMNFQKVNGHLPCPASLTELASTASFGKEVNGGICTFTTAPAGVARFETAPGSGVFVVSGMVPVAQLSLPPDQWVDEFGNRYSYTVMQSLTEIDTFTDGAGALVVTAGNTPRAVNDAAFVVLSHGKEGAGAYRFESGVLMAPCGTTTLDSENCDGDITFVESALADVEVGANYYSDVIRWKSKLHFYQAEEVSTTACTLPWGGTISHGQEVVAYRTAVADPVCLSQQRLCTNGWLTGKYTVENCYGLPPLEKAFRLDGVAMSDKAGVAGAIGDVNGDGFGDAIIGATDTDHQGTSSGSVYVVFGSATGINARPANLSTLDGSNGFRLDGFFTGHMIGSALSVGDVNNDGFDDILVGSAGFSNSGMTYIVFGKASGWSGTINLASLNGTNGIRLDGATAGDQFGASVASGDVNGDGIADIIMGAPGAGYGGSLAGAVYVVFGRTTAWTGIDIFNPNGTSVLRIDGQANSRIGARVSYGDVNKDGVADIISGALNTLTVGHVIFGKATGWTATSSISTLDGTTGFSLADAAGDWNTSHVGSGDINGDGADDVLIGTRKGSNNWHYAHVIFGKASGWTASVSLSTLYGTAGFSLVNTRADLNAMPTLGSGDVNGDGFDDVVVGLREAELNGITDSGTTYVAFGKASGWPTSTNLVEITGTKGFRVDGSMPTDRSGFGVAVGDLTGDGYDDILIAAAEADYNKRLDSGAIYGVYGRPNSDPLPSQSLLNALARIMNFSGFRLDGEAQSDYAGYAAASGDINGDGFDDVIIGAFGANPGNTNWNGTTYVYFGAANGLPTPLRLTSLNGINGFRLVGEGSADYSGMSVAAGDVNNDGFDDVIIGAPYASPGGRSWAGATYIVFGKASGWTASMFLSTLLTGTHGVRLDGAAANDLSGYPVSTGDVNNDGFDDVIVGADGASPGGRSAAGSTFVVFGKASGWTGIMDLASVNGVNGFRLDGAAAIDLSGMGASAGDVNGDGFDDVIIGAYLADPSGRTDAGSTYVVFGKASGWSAAINLGSVNGANGFRLDGAVAGDNSGYPVANGDVNGDGFDDVIVGVFLADPSVRANAGSTYVVFGKASGWSATMELASLDGTNGFRLDGQFAGDQSGFNVASGDINDDGFADIFVGATRANPGGRYWAGSAYAVFGKASGWSATMELASVNGTNGFRMDGAAATHLAGAAFATGDLTGDGIDDLIIGAYGADYNATMDAGSTYGLYGRTSGWYAAYYLDALSASLAAAVVNQQLFYNQSVFDGYDAAMNSADDAAIAPDKTPLTQGFPSAFQHYSSYALGLNGLIIDIENLPPATTASDILSSLQFQTWNGIAAGGFATLSPSIVPSVLLRPGAGLGGSTRIHVTFPNNAIRDTWLRVTVLANSFTGLTANNVFAFGHVFAEANIGNTTTRYRVNATDISSIRNNFKPVAGVSDWYDLNRDGVVDSNDETICQNNQQIVGIVAPITY